MLVAGTLPPQWTKSASNPLVTSPYPTGQNQMGYPTLIKASGRLASPIDTWYMWCAPHDPPGGIYLYTAPALEGPWTLRNSASAVIPTPTGVGDHISSPYVLWNPNTSKLMMWAHIGGLVGHTQNQQTYLYTSTDGVTWTIANGGSPVITYGVDNVDKDGCYAAYTNVLWDGSQFVGYYQGVPSVNSAGSDAYCLRATSPDGITWTKDGASPRPAAWTRVNSQGDYRPVPIKTAAGTFVVYTIGYSSGVAFTAFWRDVGDTRAQNPTRIYAGSTYDLGGFVPGEAVYDTAAGRLYLFGTGHPTTSGSVGDTVDCVYAVYPQNGFDLSWGKG